MEVGHIDKLLQMDFSVWEYIVYIYFCMSETIQETAFYIGIYECSTSNMCAPKRKLGGVRHLVFNKLKPFLS